MAARPPRPARGPRRPARHLVLTPRARLACTVLAVFPLPGLGVLVAGWKNPHSRLLVHGYLQMVLVLFGSYPLIIPGVAGLVWAIVDARRVHAARPPDVWSRPVEA